MPRVLQLIFYRTAVTSIGLATPCDDRPICQDGGKGKIRGLDLLHVRQLVLHVPAVTTMVCTAPCDDRPISQDGGKSATCGLDVLHVLQLSFHVPAVTTTVRWAPCDDRPIFQHGGKSPMRGLDLLSVLQAAVPKTIICTPCDDRTISRNGGSFAEFKIGRLDLLRVVQPARFVAPHVTTDPSPRMAVKRSKQPRMRTMPTCSIKQSPVCKFAAPSCASPSRTLPDELKSRPWRTPRALRARSAKLCTEAVRSDSSDTLWPLSKVTSTTTAMPTG